MEVLGCPARARSGRPLPAGAGSTRRPSAAAAAAGAADRPHARSSIYQLTRSRDCPDGPLVWLQWEAVPSVTCGTCQRASMAPRASHKVCERGGRGRCLA